MKKSLTITGMLLLLSVWIMASVALPGIQASSAAYISSEQVDEKDGTNSKEEESAFVKEIQISPRVIHNSPQAVMSVKERICLSNARKSLVTKYKSPVNSLPLLPTTSRLCLFRI